MKRLYMLLLVLFVLLFVSGCGIKDYATIIECSKDNTKEIMQSYENVKASTTLMSAKFDENDELLYYTMGEEVIFNKNVTKETLELAAQQVREEVCAYKEFKNCSVKIKGKKLIVSTNIYNADLVSEYADTSGYAFFALAQQVGATCKTSGKSANTITIEKKSIYGDGSNLNTARRNAFRTQVQSIYKAAEQQFTINSMNNTYVTCFSDSGSNKLDLGSISSTVSYRVELNPETGSVVFISVSDSSEGFSVTKGVSGGNQTVKTSEISDDSIKTGTISVTQCK